MPGSPEARKPRGIPAASGHFCGPPVALALKLFTSRRCSPGTSLAEPEPQIIEETAWMP